jgi:hypothetical protein
MKEEFSYTLLENGLDFVLSALEHLALAAGPHGTPQQKRHLKYALLHLSSGVELILKERLRQEDWKLIFQDPSTATDADFETGDFKSVTFDDSIKRLLDECPIQISSKQKSELKGFRLLRNKVEHFGANESLIAVQSRTVKMVSVLLELLKEFFEPGDLDDEESLLAEIREKLGTCKAIVDHRWKEIQKEVKEHYSTITCPHCRQDSLTADGGTVECSFCVSVRGTRLEERHQAPAE